MDYLSGLCFSIYPSIHLSKTQLLGLSSVLFVISLLFPVGNYLLQRTMSFGVCFILGYYLKDKDWVRSKKLFVANVGLFAGYLLFWYQFNGVKISYSKPGLDGLVYLVSILLSFKIFELLTQYRTSVFWKRLGLHAIEIYLYHSVIVSAYRIVLIKLGFTDVLTHVIIGIPITWGLTMLATAISKKVRILDFFLHPLSYLTVD